MVIATAEERYMLQLINEERSSRELGTLELEQNLNLSADIHSQWMSDTNTFSHTGYNGTSAGDRMRDAAFDFGTSWGWAENLAARGDNLNGTHMDEVEQLHEQLMNSSGHRKNLLNPAYEYIGIGILVAPYDYGSGAEMSVLATQNFAYSNGQIDLDTGIVAPDPEPPQPDPEPEVDVQPEPEVDVPPQPEPEVDVPPQPEPEPEVDVQPEPVAADPLVISGDTGNNDIVGDSGNDTLRGQAGNDTIMGNDGNDLLTGGRGNDVLYGGDGLNKLVGQKGDDALFGGDQRDVLNGGGGYDTLEGGAGNDRLKGGARDDLLSGGDGPDKLFGNAGNDTMYGDAGDDTMNGGGGDDLIAGGIGDDYMRGGGGEDAFVFSLDEGNDRIADYTAGEDVLSFDSAMFELDDFGATIADTVDNIFANYASVVGGDLVFDFNNGSSVSLLGVTDTTGLIIEIFDII